MSLGLPDKYKSSMVREVQDKTIRKFYQELFGQKDGSKNGKDIEKSVIRNYAQKKKTAARMAGEKPEPIITEKGAGSKAQRSLGITGVSVANRNNAGDPTFVLSKLLFHMSHLP